MPGYGYAKVSKTTQKEWQKNLENYLLKRENLGHCFLFIDSRHGLLDNDMQMVDWLILNKVPFINILAKCDLVKQNEILKRKKEIEYFTKTMCMPFSIKKPIYRDKILDFIEFNIN